MAKPKPQDLPDLKNILKQLQSVSQGFNYLAIADLPTDASLPKLKRCSLHGSLILKTLLSTKIIAGKDCFDGLPKPDFQSEKCLDEWYPQWIRSVIMLSSKYRKDVSAPWHTFIDLITGEETTRTIQLKAKASQDVCSLLTKLIENVDLFFPAKWFKDHTHNLIDSNQLRQAAFKGRIRARSVHPQKPSGRKTYSLLDAKREWSDCFLVNHKAL
ncbi:MAG: hypothetical protein WC975_06530 [Phycisphaerae bacterium]